MNDICICCGFEDSEIEIIDGDHWCSTCAEELRLESDTFELHNADDMRCE